MFWQARITVARAVYSSAEIVLLDDVCKHSLGSIDMRADLYHRFWQLW